MVQQRIVRQVDEDLGIAGIPAPGGNPQGPPVVRMESDLVAHEGIIADVLRGIGPATLDHEVGLDPLKEMAVVIVLPGPANDPGNGRRSFPGEKPDDE